MTGLVCTVHVPPGESASSYVAVFRLAALVCVDGLEFNLHNPSEAQSKLLKCLPPLVICIPSHSGVFGSPEVALAWRPHVAVIVANSCSWKPSVIRSAQSSETEIFEGNGNAVRIGILGQSPPPV